MDRSLPVRHWNLIFLATITFLLGHARLAHALAPLGVYVGAAYGQGRLDGEFAAPATHFQPASSVGFAGDHSASELMAGVRPIPLIGAEVAYFDLGRPPQEALAFPGTYVIGAADARAKGATAFGVLYLPIPVIDVFLKAGLARLQATSNVTLIDTNVFCAINVPNCNVYTRHDNVTRTGFAVGAGVQLRMGAWALRAEYAHYSALGGAPHLADLGVTWSFQ